MGYQDSGNRSCAFHSGNYIRCERYAGTLSRSFYVGDSISEEDIHAKYENGILYVTFPKEETKKEAEEKKFVSID